MPTLALVPSLAGFRGEVLSQSISYWSIAISGFVRVPLTASKWNLYELMKMESRRKAWPSKHRAEDK